VRRDGVLELLQLAGERAREEAAHDREDLAELDEDAAEPEHPAEEALRVLLVHALAAAGEPRRELAPEERAPPGRQLAEDARERELHHVAREDHPEDEQRADESYEEEHARVGGA
jgi:hypothetical protein